MDVIYLLSAHLGGNEASKEYHNFKEFYSLVLMAFVDAKYQFIFANCGLPGNTHDSMIFQSTSIYRKISRGAFFPHFDFSEQGCKIFPLILGDSAFEMRPWLMKPYGNEAIWECRSF